MKDSLKALAFQSGVPIVAMDTLDKFLGALIEKFELKPKTPEVKPWIGVDLDGTLAYFDGWRGIEHIGEPIQPMLKRVVDWLKEGKEVRIFTARVDGGEVALSMGNPDGAAHRDVAEVKRHIEAWCLKHIGEILPITNVKDYGMTELWDDRAVGVMCNTGESKAYIKFKALRSSRKVWSESIDKAKSELASLEDKIFDDEEDFSEPSWEELQPLMNTVVDYLQCGKLVDAAALLYVLSELNGLLEKEPKTKTPKTINLQDVKWLELIRGAEFVFDNATDRHVDLFISKASKLMHYDRDYGQAAAILYLLAKEKGQV